MVRHLLFILLFSSFLGLNAQTLYWVGGSGNFNDGQHWSLTSGGVSSGKIPNSSSDVIFDDNSSPDYNNPVVSFVGLNSVRSIYCKQEYFSIHFNGLISSNLRIGGDFQLNSKSVFSASTKLIFSNSNSVSSSVNFAGNVLQADVLFEEGKWNLRSFTLSDNNVLSFVKGEYDLGRSMIIAGDIIANSGGVKFNSQQGFVKAKNRLDFGSNVKFNANNLTVIGQKNNPNLFRIDPNADLGNNSKIINSVMACNMAYSFTSPSCKGLCDGSMTINLSAGCTTGPYTLVTNTSATACVIPGTITGVSAPTWTLGGLCGCQGQQIDFTLYDAGGPVDLLSGLSMPADPTKIKMQNVVSFQPSCFGGCNGSFTFIFIGGAGPYSYTVNPPGNSAAGIFPVVTTTAAGLCAGTHTFTIKDSKGCKVDTSFVIVPQTSITPNPSSANVTCFGANNGTAAVSPTGGTPGYTVNWSNGALNTVSVTGLPPTPPILTATITDTKGCAVTQTFSISQPLIMTIVPTKTNVSCGGGSNGTASITAGGGTPGYTYVWSAPGGTTTSITNIIAGTYTCTVTDSKGCSTFTTITITQPPPITLTPTFTTNVCFGNCLGSANANPTGGTPGFTFTWTAPGNVVIGNSQTVSGLCNGIYTVNVKDAAALGGCTKQTTVQITSPPAITLTINTASVNCFGACNGSATATAIGGTGIFTYTFVNSVGTVVSSTNTAVNLCAGNYTATIKDVPNGCSTFITFNIAQPTPIVQNVTTTSVSCSGACNGSINSIPSGGTGPYTFTLASSTATVFTAPPYINLCAGIYTLTVGGNPASCKVTQTVSILQPNTFTLSIVTTSLSCFGDCNASLAGSIIGGTGPYTFTWTTPSTTLSTAAINGQCVGNYTFAVKDANGCTSSVTATITSPPPITVTITATAATCNGSCNGILSAGVGGGTPGYTYNWSSPGSVLSSMNGLCAGNYTLTVTDVKGCTVTATSTITAPPAIVITTTAVPTNCAGSCDGQAIANAVGGTPGYVYSWNSIPTQTTAATTAVLCAGNYVVNVTDSKGCINSANVIITSPPALSAAITGVKPSCNVCIGAATVTAGGGTAPYQYTWTPSAQTTSVATNLCIGNYTVLVKDSKGCTVTTTVNIAQTILIILTTNGSTLACNGACTGIATANAAGGLLPYTYVWNNSIPAVISNTDVATNLCAGAYTVTVSDANLCSNTATIAFSNPPAINVTFTTTNAKCNTQCNGAISVTATGGTGAISYTWSPGNPTGQGTPNITNLCAGTYTLNLKDANSCVKQQTFTITDPPAIVSTFTANNPTTCTGTNGSIFSTVSGGTGPYQYTWTPPGTINTSSIGGISAGTYSLVVKDFAGCTTTLITTLSDPLGPTVTVTSNSILCNGSCSGTATVSALGSGPFNILWSAPISSTNTTVSGICQGTFAVNVTDALNCLTSKTLSISQPPTFSLNPTVTNPGCASACTGSIVTAPAGGTPVYNFTWSPGAVNSQNLNNICSGTYTANIKDANNCAYTQTFNIVQPSILSLTFTTANVKCNSICNGSISVSVSGGTAPYTYSWTPVGAFPGSLLSNVINLCANIYSVTVKDANNCSTTATVQITEPAALTTTVVAVGAICNGQCNGSATVTIAGGTPLYAISWSGSGVITSTINSLCAGNYTSTVTDANGCVVTKSLSISQPAPITVTLTPTNPKCNGSCDGSISTLVAGGTPAYTYSWIPAGAAVQNPTNLCAGSYTGIVTDINGCKGQNVTVLTNPAKLLANVTFTNPSCAANCNGAAISNPSNGTAPFTYTWTGPPVQNTQSVNALCAGTYSYIVKDSKGCLDTQQVVLVNPPTLTINPAIAPATCGAASCNGSITIAALGGTPSYSFAWSAPIVSTTSVVTNVCAGLYTVTVTDSKSCSATFTIPVSNSNGPSGSTISFTNVTCNSLCNGAASVTNPVGGTPTYTVMWVATSSTVMPFTNLCANTYTVKITDSALPTGCILFQSVVISQPPPLLANSTINLPLCNGVCNGSITSAPTGGNPGYNFNWSTGASNAGLTSTVTSLCTGNYTLNITDTKGCVSTQTFNMPGSTSITGNTVAVNNKCFGNCNGSILAAAVAGGSPPYTFNWSDPMGQSTAQATGLCNGNYFVIIKDTKGCFDTLKSKITSPAAITLTSSVVQPTCGLCNGTSTVGALGGTAPFTYSWSSGATGITASNLCAGLYMVSITDNQGCAQNVSVTINNSSTISSTISSTNETCFAQCNGTASVTASGGTAPLSFAWVSPTSTLSSLSGLCGGTYFVQITDSKGCIRTESATINSATNLTVTPFVTQPTCLANNDGTITVNVTGGAGAITYNWAPVAGATATLNNIGAGTYTLTITRGGCTKTSVFVISNQNGPVVNLTSTNPLCNGVCSGVANLTVTSGVGPYVFNWSSGAAVNTPSASTASGLCNGLVTVTVTAGNGCKVTQNVNITQPTPIVNSLPIIKIPKCNNDCNGSISLVTSGGTLPYIYAWNPAGNTNPLINLCAGPYTATITDANGCASASTFTLLNPPPFGLAVGTVSSSCNTTPDGAITTTVTGGVPAYSYTWTGPATFTSNAAILNNILSGTYSLSLTDFAGCKKDTVVQVISTVTVIANAGKDSAFCQNENYLLNGSLSTGALTYQWIQVTSGGTVNIAPTQTTIVSPVLGTSTFVLIASNSGCVSKDTMKLTSNALPIVDAGPDAIMPIYTSTVIGGSPTAPTAITFSWTPSTFLDNGTIANPMASNTVNTTYTVTVTDANGCTASDTMHVLIYPQIVIPNGFSPNADGKNDTWMIDNIQQFPDCTVEVFNRWGESLLYSKGYTQTWDGRYKGKELPVGTYYYIIDLHHPAFTKAYTGPLTIFR